MNAVDVILRGESLFVRVALGMLRKLPGAARTVYEAIHVAARKGREIPLTDREISRECGIGRRCVQKGLRQLEDLGIISRLRQHGRRIITFLVNFASKAKTKPASKSGQGPEGPQSPTEPGAPVAAGVTPEQNRNRSGPEMARKIIDDLKAKERRIILDDEGKMRIEKLRDDVEPLGADLERLLWMHKEDIRNWLLATRARE